MLPATVTALEDGLACIQALRKDEREAARRELKVQIKQAEREGRMQDALRMMQHLGKIN